MVEKLSFFFDVINEIKLPLTNSGITKFPLVTIHLETSGSPNVHFLMNDAEIVLIFISSYI